MAYRASEDCKIYPLSNLAGSAGDPFGPYDIGGTYAASDWVDIAGFDRAFGFIEIDTTFNASDTVDTIKIEQDNVGDGTNAKDVTTSGSGSGFNYDNASGQVLKGAAKRFAIVEIRAENLDSGNGFHYIHLKAGASGNTGTDNIKGFLMLHEAKHKQKQQQGAAAANAAIYVTPTSSY